MLLALLHPDVYDEVAKGTRQRESGSTRPRAVLFQGPPGCGKTTSAKCAQLMAPFSHLHRQMQKSSMPCHAVPSGLKHKRALFACLHFRVIASQAAVPLVYVPLEAVASKWYGESERNLSEIFKAAEDLGGAIIFLDEIDSLATQRRSASRPLL